MADAPTTRASLLVRLRDGGDADAWRQFVGLYPPLVYRFGRRHGLQGADTAGVCPQVRLEERPRPGPARRPVSGPPGLPP
jgi:hypothetical protein